MTEAELREFLVWFKAEQERQWADCASHLKLGISVEAEPRAAEWQWQPGTRWLPMTEEEIKATEQRWNLIFPWDYRIFLSICGIPDRPALVERWLDDQQIEVVEAHSFMNWRGPDLEIAQRLSWPIMGLFEEGKRPWWWDDSWGKWESQSLPNETVTRWEEANLILSAARVAPQLIPFYSHRMLLPLPEQASAYLSVMGSDIIVYARDLRGGVLADLCGDLTAEQERRFSTTTYTSQVDLEDVPFWGKIIS